MSAEIVSLYPTSFEQSETLLHKSCCYGNKLQANKSTDPIIGLHVQVERFF